MNYLASFDSLILGAEIEAIGTAYFISLPNLFHYFILLKNYYFQNTFFGTKF